MTTIKSERIRHGLTQAQLKSLTGIPVRTIQNWEGGQRKCPEYVEKMILEKLARLNDSHHEAQWKDAENGKFYCSNCFSQYSDVDEFNFCPNCGAKIKKG